MQNESDVPTPYATTCFGDASIGHSGCGTVFMTAELYNAQMQAADNTWRCARCGCEASWSDAIYEEAMDALEADADREMDDER